jgi:hypothetical protein
MNSANKHIAGRILFLINPISLGKRNHEVIVKLGKLVQEVGLVLMLTLQV